MSLFCPSDCHDFVDDIQKDMKIIQFEKSRKYGFDFFLDKPLEASKNPKFNWEESSPIPCLSPGKKHARSSIVPSGRASMSTCPSSRPSLDDIPDLAPVEWNFKLANVV